MSRTNSKWQVAGSGSYIETISPTGYDLLVNGSNKYVNFNTVSGSLGYGFRDNGGTMEFKNSGGSWNAIPTGAGLGTVTSVASADGSITVTNPTTTVDLAVVKAPKLTTARTIGGVSFDGTANITVATATGGFTVSGGNLILGTNSITMTGSLAATGARVTKGWFTDIESTNAPTVSGAAVYYSGGTDVALVDGGTGKSAITALSIWVANSANTLTEITPGANNSVRVNAAGNAWEAYTPGAGGVPTTITVANEATDTTCFLGFFTAATGDLGPKTNANMTFNSNTGVATFASTVLTTTDINGGTVDGTTIGASSATTGLFTTIGGTVITGNSFVPNSSTIPSNGMYLPAANTLGWGINSAAEMQLTSTALSPGADGGSSLGTTALGWQNLFSNTGFVWNIENGDWVATHTAGILTVGTGDLRVTNNFTNATSVVTLGGAQTLTSKTLTTPVINGTITGTGQATIATVSTIAMRDASGNSAFVNALEGFSTTATAAGTTVLTVASNNMQYFTGATTQTVTLPVAATLVTGLSYWIVNLSSGAVTVNSSGGNAVVILAGGTSAEVTCILASGTSAASWNAMYIADIVASGKKLTVNNTLTLAGTDGTTMTFPTTSATIARTDAANTFSGTQTFGGTVDLGSQSLTMTGSLAATGARVTKGWFTDVESTNMYTVGGTSLTTVAQSFQNKTITNSNNVLGGVTMTLGSDADGDIYYRSSGVLTRLAKGTALQNLRMNAGATAPEWAAASGGATFVTQDIGLASGSQTPTNEYVTSDAAGTAMFLIIAPSTTCTIYRFVKDTSTLNYYCTHTTTLTVDSGAVRGVAVVGSNLYVSCVITAGNSLRRYVAADLTSVTSMTFSGTSRASIMWSDDTNLYIFNGTASQFDKFTISGTTATNAGAITYTALGTPACAVGNATSVWTSADSGTSTFNIKKYPIAGGAATSTTSPILACGAWLGGSSANAQIHFGSTSVLAIGWIFNWCSAAAVVGMGYHTLGIALP